MRNGNDSKWKVYKKVQIQLGREETYCGIQAPTGYIYHDQSAEEVANAHLIETDNDGFNLRIIGVDEKYNYWICLVAKGNLMFFIRLYTKTIFELLLYSNFANGVCSQPVMFGTYKSQIGVLHKGMPVYQQIMAEEAIKAQSKTSKWEIGRLYLTKTKADILLGYFPYVQCDISYKGNDGYVNINLDENPRKAAIIGSYQEGRTLDKVIASGLGFGIKVNYVESLPSRAAGKKLFTEQEIMQHFINYIRNTVDNYVLKFESETREYKAYEYLKLILIVYYMNREIGKDLLCKLYNLFMNTEKEFMYKKVKSKIVVMGEQFNADDLCNIVFNVCEKLINR